MSATTSAGPSVQIQKGELQLRVDIAQEDHPGVAPPLGHPGVEVREDTGAGLQRRSAPIVLAVLAGPEEARPRELRHPAEVNTALPQEVELEERVVVPHRSDDPHLAE